MEIYIHLPFCKSKCQYCDFNSYACKDDALIYTYFAALIREIRFAATSYGQSKIDTVYIGGGTPSMLDAGKIKSVCKALKESFDLSAVKEFSIEANPESITEDKLASYSEVGVDRISIGVQSLDDRNLKSVGRLHDSATALEKIKLAGKYFDNVSADVIIGLPYDSAEGISREIGALAPLVKHMSVYQLTLEEGTPLKKRVDEGKVWLPSDDEVADYQLLVTKILGEHGFERYEISNYARQGYASRHNMGYWMGEEYLGFGAGAHSMVRSDGGKRLSAQVRFANPRDLNAYIGGVNCAPAYDKIPRAEMSVQNEREIISERIMLGLRTSKGVDEKLLEGRVPPELEQFFERKAGRASLTPRGMEVMNGILLRIL